MDQDVKLFPVWGRNPQHKIYAHKTCPITDRETYANDLKTTVKEKPMKAKAREKKKSHKLHSQVFKAVFWGLYFAYLMKQKVGKFG